MRNLSAAGLESIWAPSSPDTWMICLTITDPDNPVSVDPIYLITDTQSHVRDLTLNDPPGPVDAVFVPIGMGIQLPNSSSFGEELRIVIDNVDKQIGLGVRAAHRPQVLMEVVSTLDVDLVEISESFMLSRVEITESTVSATAIAAYGMRNEWPSQRRTRLNAAEIFLAVIDE